MDHHGRSYHERQPRPTLVIVSVCFTLCCNSLFHCCAVQYNAIQCNTIPLLNKIFFTSKPIHVINLSISKFVIHSKSFGSRSWALLFNRNKGHGSYKSHYAIFTVSIVEHHPPPYAVAFNKTCTVQPWNGFQDSAHNQDQKSMRWQHTKHFDGHDTSPTMLAVV